MTRQTAVPDQNVRFLSSLFGVQIFLAVFGGLVALPLLTGLSPSVALFTAGVGTLIFYFFTRRAVPVFLGPSFAFAAPMVVGIKTWGIPATMGGLVIAALVYLVFSALAKWKGRHLLDVIFPPIVVGPVVMVLGLILIPVAVSMMLGRAQPEHDIARKSALLISVTTLAATAAIYLFARGRFKLTAVLGGVLLGYLVALPLGIIDFSIVLRAPWIAVPDFSLPQFNWHAVVFLLPAAVVPAIEHLAGILALAEVTGTNYLKAPGLQRTLLGNGIAAILALCLGGPPNAVNTEATGAVGFFKINAPAPLIWAAGLALAMAFVGKVGALLQTIPAPVTGGILVLLFVTVLMAGINCLQKSGQDLMRLRNLLIAGLTLTAGIGGLTFSAGAFCLKGVALATIVGVVLNLTLPGKKTTQGHD